MVDLRIPWSSIFLPSWLFIRSIIVYDLIRLSCIYLIISPSIYSSSSSSSISNDRALDIVESIDKYLCKNYVLTCFFRQRHHQSFNKDQQQQPQLDRCKSLLILRFCLYHDVALTLECPSSTLAPVKAQLSTEIPSHCSTLSSYKTMYAQHLRSIAPSSRTTFKWQTFGLLLSLSLFLAVLIRTRPCYC